MKKFLISLLCIIALAIIGFGGVYSYYNHRQIVSWIKGEKNEEDKGTDELRSELTNAKSKLELERQNSANLTSQLAEKQQENSTLISKVDILENRISTNNTRIAELEQNEEVNTGEILRLQNENAQLTTDKNDLQSQINENSVTVANLQGQLTAKDELIAELQNTVEQLQEQLNNQVTNGLFSELMKGTLTTVTANDLDGVTAIKNYAFAGCDKLVSVELPTTITSIGNYAFSGCKALTNLLLPDAVTKIGTYAFENCSSLITMIIPSGVKSISAGTFQYCTGLTTLVIPASVTSIGSSAFTSYVGGFPEPTFRFDCYLNSAEIYTQLTSLTACGGLLKSNMNYPYYNSLYVPIEIVDNEENTNNFLNDETNYTKTTSDDGNYYVFTKV